MKNSIIKVLALAIIGVMMMSTVASAATEVGSVKVTEKEVTIPGYNTEDFSRPDWNAAIANDFAGFTTGATTVETATSVFSRDQSGTTPQVKTIEGFYIPENQVDGFTITHDDGIKVIIDGVEVVLNKWAPMPRTTTTIPNTLNAFEIYSIRIDYFDWGGKGVLLTNLDLNGFYDEIPEYTVTYEDNKNGTSVDEVVEHGLAAVGIDAPTKEGFVFEGWSLGESFYTLESFYNFDDAVISDLLLTAVWSDDVNLWVSADDAATVYINGSSVAFDPSIEAYTGADKRNWNRVSTTYVFGVETNPLVAIKGTDIFGVVAGVNLVLELGESSFEQTDGNWWYYNGDEEIASDWMDAGYVSEDWDEVSVVAPHGSWVNDNMFPANDANKWIWSPNYLGDNGIDQVVYLRNMQPEIPVTEYTVITNSNDMSMGLTSPEEQVYPEGSSATVVAAPEAGYKFVGWYTEGETSDTEEGPLAGLTFVSSEQSYEFTVMNNVWLLGVFELISTPPSPVYYDLTVSATEGGTVPGLLGTNTFASGTSVLLDPVAEEGYEFTGWTGSVAGNTVVLTSDKSVTANFTLIEEEIIEEETPEETPVVVEEEEKVVEEEILDEETPENVEMTDEELPEAGGASAVLFYALGTAFIGIGATTKRKKNK